MRVVLDVNVYVSAALSSSGVPARLIRAWLDGAFEVVASPLLLGELKVTLEYRKFAPVINAADVAGILDTVAGNAEMVLDPVGEGHPASREPDDDYLLALSDRARAPIVSGDKGLLTVHGRTSFSPREFFVLLMSLGRI